MTTLVCAACLIWGSDPTGGPLGLIAMHDGTSYCRFHLQKHVLRDDHRADS